MKPKQSETKAALKGMAWLSSGRLVSVLLKLVTTAVLARLLTPTDFGIMAAAIIIIDLSAVLFEGAFGTGIIQKHELTDRCASNTFWASLYVGGLLMALTIILAPYIQSFFGFPNLDLILKATSLSLLFKAAGNVPAAMMRRNGAFRSLAFRSVCSYFVAYGPIAIGLAWAGFGVWALVLAMVCASALDSVLTFAYSKVSIKRPPSIKEIKEVFAFSGYFTLSQLFNWAARTGADTVVGRMLGAQQLGIYSRGWKLLDVITSSTAGPIQNVLFPSFSRMQNDPEKAKKAFSKALNASVFVFAIISAFAVVHGKAIVLIALGEQWMDVVPVIQFLFLVLVPRCCFKVSESIVMGMGKAKAAATAQGSYALLMIGGALIGATDGPSSVALYVSLAVTLYYTGMLFLAAQITGLRAKEIGGMHLRALLLAAAVAAVDIGTMTALSGAGFWAQQMMGGFVSVTVLMVMFALLPSKWIGKDIGQMRTKILEKIRGSRA